MSRRFAHNIKSTIAFWTTLADTNPSKPRRPLAEAREGSAPWEILKSDFEHRPMDPSKRSVGERRKPTWIERISNRHRPQIMPAMYLPNDAPLPSFFIVGPPRTGTSWLHEILRRHAVLPFPTKETRFFDCHFHRGIEWYRAHYPRERATLPVGEIAPTYFASREARERMAQVVPGAR